MKTALMGLLFVVLVAGAAGGTWYYMDMNLKAANERTSVAETQLATTQAGLTAAQAELQAQKDKEAQEAEMLTALEALMMTGTGVDMTALQTYYADDASFEGTLTGASLRSYTLALQKYNKSLAANEGVKAIPLKLKSDDWSVVVALKEKNIQAPLVLNQSGSIVRAPAKIGQEMVLILSKWQEGKIVEQYEFPYVGDASTSRLMNYIPVLETSSGSTTSEKLMQGATETTDTPMGTFDDIIPAESSQKAQSTGATSTGTTR